MRLSLIQTCATAAVTAAVMLGLSLIHGCGPGEPEYDKAALYSPESLAQELAARYQDLSPDARKTAAGSRASLEAAKITAAKEKAELVRKKGVTGEAVQKQARPATVDDLLADIGNKLTLIKGMSRADACRKMIDTFSNDRSLSAPDKKALTELVGKLAE